MMVQYARLAKHCSMEKPVRCEGACKNAMLQEVPCVSMGFQCELIRDNDIIIDVQHAAQQGRIVILHCYLCVHMSNS